MNFLTLTESSRDTYEQFIAAERGSFLQTWAWGDFQSSLNQKVFRFALQENNELKLLAQFIEQTIPHLGGKYLYAPYGPVGDLTLTPELIKAIRKQHPDYWFIRIEPQHEAPRIGKKTLRIQPGKTLLTNLTKPEDELQARMHTKTRYNIKVAKKHGVTIEQLPATHEQLQLALNLISETSVRQGFTDHPKTYYKKIAGLNNQNNEHLTVRVYVSVYQGQFLNCAIIVDSHDTRTYLFGGSSDKHKNVMAAYLLHWQALLDAKSAGRKFYDWWGIETSTGKVSGFTRFKLGWPGQEVSYPTPQDVVLKPVHYLVYKFLRQINRLF